MVHRRFGAQCTTANSTGSSAQPSRAAPAEQLQARPALQSPQAPLHCKQPTSSIRNSSTGSSVPSTSTAMASSCAAPGCCTRCTCCSGWPHAARERTAVATLLASCSRLAWSVLCTESCALPGAHTCGGKVPARGGRALVGRWQVGLRQLACIWELGLATEAVNGLYKRAGAQRAVGAGCACVPARRTSVSLFPPTALVTRIKCLFSRMLAQRPRGCSCREGGSPAVGKLTDGARPSREAACTAQVAVQRQADLAPKPVSRRCAPAGAPAAPQRRRRPVVPPPTPARALPPGAQRRGAGPAAGAARRNGGRRRGGPRSAQRRWSRLGPQRILNPSSRLPAANCPP
jgi:hypothetical protein